MRKLLYLIVFITNSLANAGSYDDFFMAIKQDNAQVIGTLLELGFDPNTPDPAGQFPLIIAIRDGSLQVAERLLPHAATRIEVRTSQDESPLMLAALKGYLDLCKQLIAKDADVNKPGWTPLHYAATGGHVAIVELLLRHHAYIDAASPNGSTPLMMAARYGNMESVRLLLAEGADPMLKNSLGLSAIAFANSVGKTDSADLIASAIRARRPKGTW